MAFLVLVGGIQFVYCVLIGNYVSLYFIYLFVCFNSISHVDIASNWISWDIP